MPSKYDTILDNFNFSKVHLVMTMLNWRWANVGGVPSVEELKHKAIDLLEEAEEHATQAKRPYTVATGGLEATCTLYPGDSEHYYSLKFVLTEWDNCY